MFGTVKNSSKVLKYTDTINIYQYENIKKNTHNTITLFKKQHLEIKKLNIHVLTI